MPPASRITDMHVCPMVTGIVPHVGGPILPPGAPTVLIGFLPAATVTTMATCVGPPDVIVKGSMGVMINFLPAARIGDLTAHGGVIILGESTVIIGEIGGGGAGGGGGAPGGGGVGGMMAGLAASALNAVMNAASLASSVAQAASPAKPGPDTQKYATAEAAAIAAMKASNPASVKEGREYGGWVRKNSDGTYTPRPATRGTKDGLTNMPDKGTDDVAWWHTHGANDPGYNNENFSGATGDKGYSKANSAVGYLATPTGVIKRYDPGTNTVTTLPDTAKP